MDPTLQRDTIVCLAFLACLLVAFPLVHLIRMRFGRVAGHAHSYDPEVHGTLYGGPVKAHDKAVFKNLEHGWSVSAASEEEKNHTA